MSEKIDVGDSVLIHVTDKIQVEGRVLYSPCATGDAWKIKDRHSEQLIYVQTYLCMIKVTP